MRRPRLTLLSCMLAAAILSTVGCFKGDTPELGYVEGNVTLDGEPLEGALITFYPQGGGRPSYGRTNASGWYEMIYTNQAKGVLPGEHSISISTFQRAEDGVEGSPETVPAKYNVETELTRTVEASDNVIDFELDSEGEIMEPDETGEYSPVSP